LSRDCTALFTLHGGVAHPHLVGRGPWNHGFLHGGAVCGLAGHLVEAALDERLGPDHGLAGARLTVEILSMVPVAPLVVAAEVVKPGRRSAIVSARISHEGRVVARASSSWTAVGPDGTAGAGAPAPGAPAAGAVPPRPATVLHPDATESVDYPRPGFNCDAVELRAVHGTTEDPGPGVVWARLLPAVVADRPVTPFTRAAAISDLGIAVGWEHSPTGDTFINCDVTLQLARPVRGEWLCLDSRVHAHAAGTGFCETLLSDDDGPVGRVLQSLTVTPMTFGLEARQG
jgi:acyl-coenzyme A thioesterase PaaI-like protein